MKKIILHIALGFGFFAASLVSHAAITTSASTLTLVPPSAVFVVNDLDLRDALNRPIHSLAARRNFEDLWNRNLTEMFLSSLTPIKVQMYSLLQRGWEHVKHTLSQHVARTVEKVLAFLRLPVSVDKFSSHPWSSPPLGLIAAPFFSPGFLGAYVALIISSTRILR